MYVDPNPDPTFLCDLRVSSVLGTVRTVCEYLDKPTKIFFVVVKIILKCFNYCSTTKRNIFLTMNLATSFFNILNCQKALSDPGSRIKKFHVPDPPTSCLL